MAMTKTLGNGRTISLIYDSWLQPGSNLSDRLHGIEIPQLVQSWSVSNIVDLNQWIMRDEYLQSVWSFDSSATSAQCTV